MNAFAPALTTIGAALLATLASGLAATPVRAQAPANGAQPVRIGFTCPLTGGSQDFGNSARQGAVLAIDEINQAGGYLGRKLELLVRDDRGNPDEGRRIAEEFVLQKKADFTIGFCNSGVAAKSLEVFQDNQHLLMIPVATGTGLTAKYPAASSFIFRISMRDSLQVGAIIDDIARRGLRRVAVFADSTGYGDGGLKDVQKQLADKGLQSVHVSRFDLGVSSAVLAGAMKAAQAAGAEAIIGYTIGPEQAQIARARVEAKWPVPQYGPITLSFRSAYDKGGAAVEGTMFPQTIIQDFTNERRTSFIARLRRSAGDGAPLGSLLAAAQTYDAVHLMLRALFQTQGDTRGPALKRALENFRQPYRGVVTTYDRPFDETDHDATTRNMIWMGTWRSGEVHFLYPGDARKATQMQYKTRP